MTGSRRFSVPMQVVLFGALATSPGWLGAATKTTTFAVRLTLTADCTISASDLDFGSHGVLAANVDQTSALSVTCTTNAPYQVGIDAGTTAGSSIANRLMAGTGATTVQYQIYRDSARSQVWGNTPAPIRWAAPATGRRRPSLCTGACRRSQLPRRAPIPPPSPPP